MFIRWSKLLWNKLFFTSKSYQTRQLSTFSYFYRLIFGKRSIEAAQDTKSTGVLKELKEETTMNTTKVMSAIKQLSSTPRKPMINFLHNSRPQVQKYDPNRKPQLRAAGGGIVIDELELPLRLRRRPMSQEEMDCINTGGLRPNEI
ncbi:unnamed protein product [Bursaphelenchus okinawaensis]|uniref:Uncharacterized protein n=1 Tax=Bursaphelenchus okinawaensis TaxID=465554 RepID=A0A811JR26_9BILA|nr:unnamed protein product [Bursaphelenchus okinawaensis]CAG9079573.1 unnamed protein product [Bursaphelenchus okinawaensis]